jgi:hypothetical protein
LTCACSFTRAAIAELWSMLVENDTPSAPIRSEPAIAVPSEAPRFGSKYYVANASRSAASP